MPSAELIASSVWSINNGTLPGGTALGAEVAAYDPIRKLALILGPNGVDFLDAATGARTGGIAKTDIQMPGGGGVFALGTGNSVAVRGDIVAIAFDGPAAGTNGAVALFQISANGTAATWLRTVTGPGIGTFGTPDMVVFTPDGTKLLVALEGEPTTDYAIDPMGGIGVIDVATGALQIADFTAFDGQKAALQAAGVRLNAPSDGAAPVQGAGLVSRDVEPEYITLSGDGKTAYVTLQEANSIAVVDLSGTPTVTAIHPLGMKDHGLAANSLDASDADGVKQLKEWPGLKSLYMPDAIASFEAGGQTYLVTANEGDYREYAAFNDLIQVKAATYDLDNALFPDEATLKLPANLGNLGVSRTDGDTDGDGDYDVIVTGGSRSFSIWTIENGELVQTYDSGDLIETTLLATNPALYNDTRSDNKGVEPEHVTLGRIDGELFAFVGLERTLNSSTEMAFRITGGDSVEYAGTFTASDAIDREPEAFVFVPADQAPAAIGGPLLIVPSEGGKGTRAFQLETPNVAYTLQILHASDFEAGVEAVDRAKNFAAIVDKLEDTYANSITLSSGDNFIPGAFTAAGTDPSVRDEVASFYEQLLGLTAGSLTGIRNGTLGFNQADIAILNAFGVQASVFGNHEFDLGPTALAAAFDFTASLPALPGQPTLGSITSIGAQFPYLSANLNFAAEAALSGLFNPLLADATTYATTAAELATGEGIRAEATGRETSPWTTITEGGETIGVLGITTQILASISSVGNVAVADPAGDGGVDNTAELAAILQPLIDQMTAQGINKVILLSHLQQISNERSLATKLSGVDVILGGGSNTIFADGTDTLDTGDTAGGTYPEFYTGLDGKSVALVNTDGNYNYVGRLVIEFDANGDIVPSSVDPAVSGAYVTTDAGVDAVAGNGDGTLDATESAAIFADGTRAGEVKQITDAIDAVIQVKDGNVVGFTDVFLEGRRNEVRSQETNLGSLTADANLAVAKSFDLSAVISIKNGGGIRAEIGAIDAATGDTLPPQANPDAGKPEGGISQLDIENSLRFNNPLSLVTLTAQGVLNMIENAIRGAGPGATPGAFPQVSGLKFSWDKDLPALNRVLDLVVVDQQGNVIEVIAENGSLVGSAAREFRIATLGFLAPADAAAVGGGDSIIVRGATVSDVGVGLVAGTLAVFSDFAALNRVDLVGPGTGFEQVGGEQAALADYLRSIHGTPDTAFDALDTAPAGDQRIQNLDFRAEDVIGAGPVAGAGQNDLVVGTGVANVLSTGGGDDSVSGVAGDDRLSGQRGSDVLSGGEGNDTLIGGRGDETLVGGAGADTFTFKGEDGSDVIADFTAGEDLIRLRSFGFADFAAVQALMTETADGVVIALAAGSDVLIEGATIAGLGTGDFLL